MPVGMILSNEKQTHPDSCGLRVMILEGGAGFGNYLLRAFTDADVASRVGRSPANSAVRRRHRESARTATPSAIRLIRYKMGRARAACGRDMRSKTESMKQLLTWME